MLGRIKKWFLRDDASVAIEFAMVGLPFIIMLIGMVEACLYFSTAISLEGATQSAARLIRTGQVQATNSPIDTFKAQMHSQVSSLINSDELQYQVLPIADNTFQNAADMSPQFDQDGNLMNQTFVPGISSQDVLVRVVYRYKFMTPLLGSLISGNANATATLVSSIVIQNEPYTFGQQLQ